MSSGSQLQSALNKFIPHVFLENSENYLKLKYSMLSIVM